MKLVMMLMLWMIVMMLWMIVMIAMTRMADVSMTSQFFHAFPMLTPR